MTMRKTVLSLSAFALAAAVSMPALAGPAGEGRHFTEEVSKRHQAQRTVKLAVDTTCASRAVAAVRDHSSVASAGHEGHTLRVVFHSADLAKSQAAEVRAVVNSACSAA